MSAAISIDRLIASVRNKDAVIGIIGLGYVGIPLAVAFGEVGCKVLGFDVDADKAEMTNAGKSYIKHIESDRIRALVEGGLLTATSDMDRLAEADALLICVPTPLNQHLDPDLSFVVSTTEAIARRLRPGQLIVLESTTYPGTTADVMRPILEATGLKSGADFYLAYSPEREDPGNPDFSTSIIPKVVGADDPCARDFAKAVYDMFTPQTITVSSAATAEAVKITENVFRSVNIALVNELKVVYGAMGIDVWEVIDAAATKPFGFMPFYPGPGLGGHCIPIDPFYLTWKAREYGQHTRFIELAGQINSAMPEHVVRTVATALDERFGRGLRDARVLMIGLAYKKNVDDIRESPSLQLIEMLEQRKATVDYFDPYVATIPVTREHSHLGGRKSVAWDVEKIATYDVVLIATDHDNIDYKSLVDAARLVVDSRNACARAGASMDKVVRA